MNDGKRVNSSNQSQGIAYLHSVGYDLFILVLTVFSLLVAVGLIFLPFGPAADAVLFRVDYMICVLFLIDFSLNVWRAPNRADYFIMQGGWLDLLGTVPAVPGLHWTAVFRLARLNRLVRIIQHLRGKDRDQVMAEARGAPARTALLTMIIIALLLITFASLFILRFERGVPGSDFTKGADAFWWAVVTMTTVGYGDYVPITFPGRMLAMALMIFGIGVFAVLTSAVASRMVALRRASQYDRPPDQDDLVALVREENTIIRAELAEIKELLVQQGTIEDAEV